MLWANVPGCVESEIELCTAVICLAVETVLVMVKLPGWVQLVTSPAQS